MNIDQIRDMIVTAGADPSYDVEFEVPTGGDWSGMTVNDWAVARTDWLQRIVVLTAR